MFDPLLHPCAHCPDFINCAQTDHEARCDKYHKWVELNAIIRKGRQTPAYPHIIACKALGGGPKIAVATRAPYECKEGEHIVLFDDGVYVVCEGKPHWRRIV